MPVNSIRIDLTKGGCWLWRGAKISNGYAQATINKKAHRVHKLLYHLLVGKVRPGHQLDHLCRNRHCVNPAHLEMVTPRENIIRGEGCAAKNYWKTACKNGHAFTKENTYFRPTGGRGCKVCRSNSNLKYRKARK